MHFTTITSLAALASISLAAPTKDHESRAAKGTISYCSSPDVCAPMQIKANGNCHTLFGVFPIMNVPAGMNCMVFNQGSCFASSFSSKGTVDHVTGHFDLRTDARAIKHGVGNIGSFFCD